MILCKFCTSKMTEIIELLAAAVFAASWALNCLKTNPSLSVTFAVGGCCLYVLFKKSKRFLIRIYSVGLLIIALSALYFYGAVYLDKGYANIEQIAKGNFYCLKYETKKRKLFATDMNNSTVHIFDADNLCANPLRIKIPTGELEHIAINADKNELYHFDRTDEVLLVYDLETMQLKKKSSRYLGGQWSARLAFDNHGKTIAITREKGGLWLVDMGSLAILSKYDIPKGTESIVFDGNSGSYAISFCDWIGKTLFIYPKEKKLIAKNTLILQGALAVSEKNREIYLALPLEGAIAVYDADDKIQKQKIPTVFGVRALAYDEKNNLIFAGSFCTGYIDIIDLSRMLRVARVFVGPHLREICLNSFKREAFVSSKSGGIYKFNY